LHFFTFIACIKLKIYNKKIKKRIWKTACGNGRLPGGVEGEEHDDCRDENNCHAEILLLLVHPLLPLVGGLYLLDQGP